MIHRIVPLWYAVFYNCRMVYARKKIIIPAYFFMSLFSQYFIMKENASVLADECQAVVDDKRETIDLELMGGGNYGEQEL